MITFDENFFKSVPINFGANRKKINLVGNGELMPFYTMLSSNREIEISDITSIHCMSPVLEHLDLSINRISDLNPLRFLPNLTELNLADNLM